MFEKFDVLGIPVDIVGMKDALDCFEKFLEKDDFSLIITANPEILGSALKNDELAEVIKNSPLVVPDGIGLLYAARVKGKNLKERVTGIDFSYKALQKLAAKGGKAFFLGSKPGVAEAAAKNMMKEIDGLVVSGYRDGYFTPEQEAEVVAEINASGADFLCCALGAPKQELFLARHSKELNCKVGVGIGGSLDVWSGNTKRAPEFFIKNNIEWLYRLITEPQRIGRIAKIPFFLLKVIFDIK